MAESTGIAGPRHVSELVLVRHGETTRNRKQTVGRYLAAPDQLYETGLQPDHKVRLTRRGKVEATCIGQALAGALPGHRDYNVYFDSGYARSVETLDRILKAFDLPEDGDGRREAHLDLRERDPGYTFNMTISQINQHFPWLLEYEHIYGKFYQRPPGGESVADVCSRVHMFLNSLRRARAGERVFIVTHGRVMLAFEYWLERVSARHPEEVFKSGDIPNCAVRIYRRRPEDRGFLRQSDIEQTISARYDHLFTERWASSERTAAERRKRRLPPK